jgi:signal peptidase I
MAIGCQGPLGLRPKTEGVEVETGTSVETGARGERPSSLSGWIRSALVIVAFYAVFFHLSVVRGSSMAPGIQDGDRILVEPWSLFFFRPERGDIVVLRYPLDPTIDYIKRVIGLPGDRVTLADGFVWVNGELLDEPYVTDIDRTTYLTTEVGPHRYFVLGDNRSRSSDSRDFGMVPEEYLRGRVDLRLWPLERAGVLR